MEGSIRPGRVYAVAAVIVIVGLLLSVIAGAVAGGATAYYLAGRQAASARQEIATPRAIISTATPAPSIRQEAAVAAPVSEEGVYQQVYQRVNPSVVNISVAVKAQSQTNPFLPRNTPQDQYQYGSGSGFVYDREGHIVTNNHVVEDAERIRVTFYDDVTVSATLVGRDPDSDLAVIKVSPEGLDLRPVELADSDVLSVGQRVIAIGNPFGLQGTLTTGVISALGRSLPTSEAESGGSYSIPDIIQTDAAINPGNSGGPLLDTQGRVIGVNFAIESASGSSAGVGFTIPVNFVKLIAPVLIEKGKYEHPWLGVSVVTLTPEMAEAMKLPTNQRGALVGSVTSGSPAAQAGLRASRDQITIDGQTVPVGGDLITAIEGRPVSKNDDLILQLMRYAKVGQQVKLTVIRDGKPITVNVTLAARPARS